MDRTSKEQDIKERSENYRRGMIALTGALAAFRELTGVDLTGDVDVSGRHMGQAPYVKLTAERLTEVSRLIEADIWETGETLALVTDMMAGDAEVVRIDRKSLTCAEVPALRPVIGAYRPVPS
jgi:hypothetical protein